MLFCRLRSGTLRPSHARRIAQTNSNSGGVSRPATPRGGTAAAAAGGGATVRSEEVLRGVPLLSSLGLGSAFGREVVRESLLELEAMQNAAAAKTTIKDEADHTTHRGAPKNTLADRKFASASPQHHSSAQFSGPSTAPQGKISRPTTSATSGTAAALLARTRTLGEQLASTQEEQHRISRRAERGASSLIGRYFLRRRRIDEIGIRVEAEAAELGAGHRLARALVNAATISPFVAGVISGEINVSRALQSVGLISDETVAVLFGTAAPPSEAGADAATPTTPAAPTCGLVPWWASVAGQVALTVIFYDVSAYWRYPIMHFLVGPALRALHKKIHPVRHQSNKKNADDTSGATKSSAVGSTGSAVAGTSSRRAHGQDFAQSKKWRDLDRSDARSIKGSSVSDA